MNPYSHLNFFQVISLFCKRSFLFLTGQLSLSNIASDELQIYTLILISAACVLVGTFLVLRRMAMLANSLSHTILFGLVIAFLLFKPQGLNIDFKILIIAALLSGICTALFTGLLTSRFKLQEDASIGLIFTTFFALGILLITLFTRNVHIGVEVITGNVDALHRDDLILSSRIFLLNFGIIALCYRPLKILAFDSTYAATIGIPCTFFHYLLMLLISCTAIAAFRAVGVLLVLALLTGPVLFARLFTHRLFTLMCLGLLISTILSIVSVALSRHLLSYYQMPVATSGLMVTLLALSYSIAALFKLMIKGQRKVDFKEHSQRS